MAPLNLSGLNVVRPVQQNTQDLASPFPDFSAHLDLWTNLAFESSDEPLAPSKRKFNDNDDDVHDSPSNAPPLDINALLAGIGIDTRLIPTSPPAQVHPVPSLAQLLALHAASYPPPPPTTDPSPPSNPPPTKRMRAQGPSSATDDNSDPHTPSFPEEPTQSEPSVAPTSAAEDKRRRNTAASARFRLKKKEREAALEHRAKELEDRVVELERECEGLRRENGWLKGLVVGVTGAGAAQHQHVAAK
ncbi:hypothetical protein OG21DRAFT_1502825 [Imleria badia]|nr:hypothetical protein OG21DRAFT_1502825 [Imleria badia]